MVYFRNPGTVQSVAFAELCPSVTLECGQSGDAQGIERAFQLIVDCLNLETLDHPSPSSDVHIFHTQGQIKIADGVDYSFSDREADLIFPKEFEKLNFSPLPEGFTFAQYSGDGFPLHVFNDAGEEISSEFFVKRGDRIEMKKEAFASMFTTHREVIAQDCLGYLMEELEL